MAKFGVWRILWRILWVPGIALHELAHALAVLLVGRQVRRFEVTLKGGTVHHTGGGSGGLSFAFIAFLPFLLGNALAYIFLKDALALLNEPFDVNPFVGLIFLWLSVSFANASFPSNLDMESARWD
ncbi:M50 family metallopeptidase [Candidatus Micrarchaeota archaeon]|nr:M50 family metallopeptidase [Candidatus Micrarchaeota archaeon]